MTDQTAPAMDAAVPEAAAPAPKPPRRFGGKRLWWLLPGVAVAAGLAYGIAAWMAETIDDDAGFQAGTVAAGESRAVAMASALVFREVDVHKWVGNDPFFQPGWALDDMPAWQGGIVATVSAFADHLNQVSGGEEHDLARAVGLLKYPGNVWMFDPSTSWAPTASTEKQYRSAARNLVIFNERLAAGEARLERNPAQLRALLLGAASHLDETAARLEAHLAEGHSALFDARADDLFFATKGRVYAQALILRELGWDFATLLSAEDLNQAWAPMLESLRRAAALEPLVVINGSPDGTLLPSHLTAQGFYLLRARAQLAAMIEKLES